jgi:CP family cyanate transporter-like MFS transporter
VFRLALLWLLGADLRVTVLAVPPVLPLIHRDLGLNAAAVGALSGLPVLLLGLAAIPGALLIARLGARRACLLGLAVVAVFSAARGLGPSLPVLFLATFVMGAGIAVLQPALPTLVSEWFAATPGFATAVYANGLLIGEAAPAALTIPVVLPLVGSSWPLSFVVWAVPVVAAAGLTAFLTPHVAAAPERPTPRWWPDWHDARTWQLGLMQGGTGGLYFASNAFSPGYLHAAGRPELVSLCLSALNLGQLPASAVVLIWARRLTGNKRAFLLAPLGGVAGIVAFLSPLPEVMVVGAGMIGFFTAFVLILTLALPPQIAPPGEVHRMSAGMFAIGYSLSCLVPPLGGAFWDVTRVPASAFAAGVLGSLMVLGAALSLRSPRARA